MTIDTVLWLLFLGVVGGALAVDLFVFGRRPHALSLRESACWTAAWVGLAVAVAAGVWITKGSGHFLDFVTGYLIEWSLSMDNVFVFAALLTYFAVPGAFQHQVLFWGIVGAAAMRLLFILTGVALLQRFEWMLFVFGGILILTAVRMVMHSHDATDLNRNLIIRFARRLVRVTPEYHGKRFFIRVDGRLFATPLFLALLAVELTDLVFAIESVPAILAITRDTFIVFSSNMCAILGLRALYFLLGGLIALFRYLHVGLGVILFFVGVKMLLQGVEYHGHPIHIPTPITLAIVFSIIGVSIAASVLVRERGASDEEEKRKRGKKEKSQRH